MAVKTFPIEAGHVMLFARAIGDDNPIYADAAYAQTTEPGSIIAPPTFAIASAQFDPDYFLRPKIGQPWFGSGKEPTGIKREAGAGGGGGGGGGGGLHAEQASSSSASRSPNTGIRTASWWSPHAASGCGPSGRRRQERDEHDPQGSR